MFIFAGKLLLLCFIFTHLINTATLAQPPSFINHICVNTTNYTVGSSYERNLNTTLSMLPTTNNGYGFYNLSTGLWGDKVYAVALCRGDVDSDMCEIYLNESIDILRRLCPNHKEAIVYNEDCFLRYSDNYILGDTDRKLSFSMVNVHNVTDMDQFNDALGSLLNKLIDDAASDNSLLKFASGNRTGPGNYTIYALVQCTPELSEEQCRNCFEDLNKVFPDFFVGRVGGRIYLPTCNVRYETYLFFDEITQRSIPPPPAPAPVPPPPLPPPPSPDMSFKTVKSSPQQQLGL